MSDVGYICLYDANWNALGGWTQHVCKDWSLVRKSLEWDEFTANCKGFENSKSACFVGLHDDDGEIKYVAFCGIPKTKNEMTSISGIDCRSVFNQDLIVDYGQRLASGAYKITTVKGLFDYLMEEVFNDEINAWFSFGILNNFEIDTDDLEQLTFVEDYISRTSGIRNVWNELVKCCSIYDVYIDVGIDLDETTNKYKLVFTAKRIINERNIKLSDFDATIKLNQNIVNRATAYDGETMVHYFLHNDNTISTSDAYPAKRLFPPIHQICFVEGKLEDAKSNAISLLNENKYKDKVTINLKSVFGSTLEDLDFSYFGNLVGYNPADDSSIKKLPVSQIKESSDGKKSLVFGRLSDYWFLE